MKKIYVYILAFLILFSILVSADGDFSEAKELLEERIPYNQLTEDQFEEIGDYFMELMVGEAHERMDQMMGGEGSEELRQVHINMGKNLYDEYQSTGTIQRRGMVGGNTMMGSDWGYMMYPGSGHFFWGMGLGGIFFMIIFWGLIIWVIYWIFTQFKSKETVKKSPLEIIKLRYARGEITKKEFEYMRKELHR